MRRLPASLSAIGTRSSPLVSSAAASGCAPASPSSRRGRSHRSCSSWTSPTNHLDLDAIETLEEALRRYDGALLVVSHDEAFLEAIGVEDGSGWG